MSTFKIDPLTERAIRSFISKTAEHYPLTRAILFGSRARDTHRPDSDADVAILLPGPPEKFIAVKLSMDDIAYEVLLDTGIRIQPLPIWEREWAHPETYSNPRLLEDIHHEGVPLRTPRIYCIKQNALLNRRNYCLKLEMGMAPVIAAIMLCSMRPVPLYYYQTPMCFSSFKPSVAINSVLPISLWSAVNRQILFPQNGHHLSH